MKEKRMVLCARALEPSKPRINEESKNEKT